MNVVCFNWSVKIEQGLLDVEKIEKLEKKVINIYKAGKDASFNDPYGVDVRNDTVCISIELDDCLDLISFERIALNVDLDYFVLEVGNICNEILKGIDELICKALKPQVLNLSYLRRYAKAF